MIGLLNKIVQVMFKLFKRNSSVLKCPSKRCDKCQKSHNTLLHLENRQQTQAIIENKVQTVVKNDAESEHDNDAGGQRSRLETSRKDNVLEKQSVSGISSCSIKGINSKPKISQVLLSTAIIKVFNGKNFIKCRALLDSGSQSNFITENLCKKLNLNLLKINHIVKGVGTALSNVNKQVNITIGSFQSAYEQEINCLVLQRITDRLPLISFDKNVLNLNNDWKLADPTFNINEDIDMLIGASVFWEILGSEQISLGKGLSVLRDSKFGWIVAGNSNLSSQCKDYSIFNLNNNRNLCLDKLLINFWNIEEVQVNKNMQSESERFCEDHFQKTMKRDEIGRFIVEMPFKENLSKLGKTKDMALKRFYTLEKRLNKNQNLKHFLMSTKV